MAACLKRNHAIAQLDLGDSGMQPQGGDVVIAAIAKNETLKSLKLCDNALFHEDPLARSAAAARFERMTKEELVEYATEVYEYIDGEEEHLEQLSHALQVTS